MENVTPTLSKLYDSEPMMLVMDLAKLFKEEMKKNLEEANIPVSYRPIILELSHSNGISQFELANKIGLKPPTVSITIRKMEDDGYVKRVPSQIDLRVMHVYLTEKAMAIYRLNCDKIHAIDGIVSNCLTGEEKKALLSLLIKLRDNLKEELKIKE